MGENYEHQLWFDLDADSIIHQTERMDWDLAFECAPEGWRIRLNTSRLMLAVRTGTSDWEAVKSVSGQRFRWDTSDGNPDSLALGNWRACPTEVVILDLGYSPEGNRLGYRKVQFLGLENQRYTFRYANLNGTNADTATVVQDTTFLHVHYSLRNHQALNAEPPKDAWDLLFTQYTFVFYNADNQPYMVNGVLLNPSLVAVAADSSKAFEAITAADIPNYVFSNTWDMIGYNWKSYSFDTQRYEVFPQKNYVIRDRKGFYWKLHFTDFYDATGLKGAPTFSYQKL
jgi:hypothetical protein